MLVAQDDQPVECNTGTVANDEGINVDFGYTRKVVCNATQRNERLRHDRYLRFRQPLLKRLDRAHETLGIGL